MEVKLVITSGKSAGQVVPVTVQRFFIGRAEDCQLRPNTDLVSRHHCVITVEDGLVTIRDLGSRNGTLVNEERIRGEEELKNGDKVAVGPLKFEVELAVEMAGRKKPKVESIQDAASRTVAGASEARPKDGDEFDLSDWLGEEADPLHETRPAERNSAATVSIEKEQDATPTQATPAVKPAEQTSAQGEKKLRKDEAKTPGRLPNASKKPKTADSQSAAADTLRHFFHRR